MRADSILLKRVGRALACALASAAIVTAAVRIDRREPTMAPEPTAHTADPLGAELERCRNISNPKDVDDSCRAAWEETRRRFFALHDPSEARQ